METGVRGRRNTGTLRGKSPGPSAAGAGTSGNLIREGAAARRAIDRHRAQPGSRAIVERDPLVERHAEDLDDFDAQAAAAAYRDDPDDTLRLLARIARLSPGRLSRLAHRIAAEVALDLARGDDRRRSGTRELTTGPVDSGGDLDLDSCLDAIATARRLGHPVAASDLRTRMWSQRDHALTLLVDHSGSMDGDRLVAASLAAAVLAIRSPDDYSVVAFAGEAIVIKAQREPRALSDVVNDVLALRGYGTTDLALGLRAGLSQLDRSSSSQRIAIALTDGTATSGADPSELAARFGTLHVVCPADAPPAAAELARSGGGECVRADRPTEIGRVLAGLMR